MLANESNPPEQVKVVIEDCGYTSAYEIMNNTFKGMTGFGLMLAIKSINLVCRLFYGFDLRRADCLGRMKDAKCPMLFIHGTADTFVPFEMGERLYAACTVPKDKLWVDGAIHAYSYYDAKQEYENTVIGFLNKYLDVTVTQ